MRPLLPLLPFLLAVHPTIASPTNKTGPNYGVISDLKSSETFTISETLEYEVEDADGNILTNDSRDSESKRWFDKPKGNTIIQSKPDPPKELKFISQEEGTNIHDLKDFRYADYAGAGVTIYAHDGGIYLEHSEFQAKRPKRVPKPKVERLIPKTTLEGHEFPQSLKDPDGHGTCVASKAIGLVSGVAKGANLKMVPQHDIFNHDYMLTGLDAIAKDIKNIQREKKEKKDKKGFFPVVNLSYNLGSRITRGNYWYTEYRKKYLELIELGALLVTVAGNLGPNEVDEYPAMFVEEYEFKDNLIVVGGVDVEGKMWRHSQNGPLVEAWAPAAVYDSPGSKPEGLSCASTTGANEFGRDRGTSLAVPMVSGLAAYLYSTFEELRGDGAAGKVKEAIKDNSYPRGNGPASIWNMVKENC